MYVCMLDHFNFLLLEELSSMGAGNLSYSPLYFCYLEQDATQDRCSVSICRKILLALHISVLLKMMGIFLVWVDYTDNHFGVLHEYLEIFYDFFPLNF